MAARRTWTEERDALLRQRYQQEGSELLAQECGVSKKAVNNRARRLGLITDIPKWEKAVAARVFWTPEREALLRERYPQEGVAPLVEVFGKSAEAIRSHAYILGIKSLYRNDYVAESRIENTQSVNIHYFDQWSPNMAWLLGYIWADGNISTTGTQSKRGLSLNFRCVLTDRELIEHIKQELGSSHTLALSAPTYRFNSHVKASIGIKICSTALCRTLMEQYGIPQRKSFSDIPYPTIPDEWAGHFARGFFDGDGYIYEQTSRPGIFYLGFCSAGQRFLQGLEEQVCRLSTASRRSIYQGKTVNRFEWSARKDLQKLYLFLYPQGDYMYLRRKKMKLEAAHAHA
jgi:hypothetical protein